MAQVVEAAAIGTGDRVLEVGAGTGALSVQLLDAGARLVAVEIDRDLKPVLRQVLGDRATLVFDDVLTGKHTINPCVIEALGAGPFKLVANLPYNVASPLLVNLAVDHPDMSVAVVTIQREVADRLTAPPGGGGKNYGPLSVIVQAMCEVRRVATLPPGCFWPQPKVASAVVALTRRAAPLTDDPHRLADLVHRLFNQRRKQLGSILGRDTPLPDGVEPTMRPEQLSVAQLIQLAGN